MKVLLDGKVIGEAITNHSMTLEEAIYIVLGYNVNDPEDLERAYEDGFKAAYLDDNGFYQIDTEIIEIEG